MMTTFEIEQLKKNAKAIVAAGMKTGKLRKPESTISDLQIQITRLTERIERLERKVK